MRIAVDLDGTLAETQKTVLKELRKEEQSSHSLEDVETYHFEKADFSLETFHETARRVWKNKNIPLTNKNIPKHLNQLHENHRIDIVTARGDIPKKDLKKWLGDKNIKFDGFKVDKEKTHLNYDYLIDDSPEYIGDDMKVLLHDRPYNRHAEVGDTDKRIEGFKEIKQHIKK